MMAASRNMRSGEGTAEGKPGSKRWIVVAPNFNVQGRAASSTVRDKLPYLARAGICLEVVGGVSGQQDDQVPHIRVWPLSPGALRSEFKQIIRRRYGRTGRARVLLGAVAIALAPAVLIERAFAGVSSHWGWALPAGIVAARRARRGECDIIYSSGGPVSAHLAGWIAHRLAGVPWIAEMHDPIVETCSTQTRCARISGFRERLLRRFTERMVCRDAKLAWWFTTAAFEAARDRNPCLGERGVRILPGAAPVATAAHYARGEQLVLGHFGGINEDRSFADLARGLARFLAAHPHARASLRVELYGSGMDRRGHEVARNLGLADLVHGYGLVSRESAFRRMAECDVLLLFHGHIPACREYIPSKLYDYLWSRRPVFALVHENKELVELIDRYGGIHAPSLDAPAIAVGLHAIWKGWRDGTLEPSSQAPISAADAVREILGAIGGQRPPDHWPLAECSLIRPEGEPRISNGQPAAESERSA